MDASRKMALLWIRTIMPACRVVLADIEVSGDQTSNGLNRFVRKPRPEFLNTVLAGRDDWPASRVGGRCEERESGHPTKTP